ncbi:MAG: YafY family transcriptional regulator [Flavisolibacter sp.]|nr:YafY family transcriptional regulator [Flavisolibacter sp.]
MNRIDRLAAILIQLQSRPLVKAQDIAAKFSISLRTVYRDIRALEEAGVPIIGEAGTGYRLMEGYKLPPVMLNQDEAAAMLTAAKLMQTMSDAPLSKYYNSALDKIKAVLRSTEKYHIAEMDEHIAVVSHPTFVYEKPAELHLPKILQAIASSNLLEFNYTSIGKNELLLRKAEPIGIYYQNTHWYLVAYCHLRKDYRTFRTDKISKLVIADEKMSQQHPPLQHFINHEAEKKQLKKVVIDVESQVVKYFGEQKYYNGFVKEEALGDNVRMTFLTQSLTGFARWFILFGDYATIVEPTELKELIAGLAEKILEKVRHPSALLT